MEAIAPYLVVIAPYLVVVGVAFLVTLLELLRTFGTSFYLALRTPWAWLLIFANTIFASITYAIAAATLTIGTGWLSAAICGLVFPAILRSRFTIFSAVDGKKNSNFQSISVPLDKLYSAIQKQCYREVDSWQAAHKTLKAQALVARTNEEHLVSAIKRVIAARRVAEDKASDEQFLRDICADTDQELRKHQLALFLIDIAGGREDDLLAQ